MGKRLRRKVYLRDSGIFHSLMAIPSWAVLEAHPKLGASWEGFALEQTLRAWKVPTGEAFYWAVHNGPEVDLLLFRGGKRIGVEFKFADAPVATRSMRKAKELPGARADRNGFIPGPYDTPWTTVSPPCR